MGLSRNKVAVSEGAAGSPPFYGERVTDRKVLLYSLTKKRFDEEELMECCSIFSDEELLSIVGVTNAEGPPVPIPNTEVKLCSGENTWLEAARENSSMPTRPRKRKLPRVEIKKARKTGV